MGAVLPRFQVLLPGISLEAPLGMNESSWGLSEGI